MRIETIKKLCCPFDKSDLTLSIITKDEQNNILEGLLSCTACQRVYPIVTGIPIMNPDEYRDFDRERPMLEKWDQLLETEQGENIKIIEGNLKTID